MAGLILSWTVITSHDIWRLTHAGTGRPANARFASRLGAAEKLKAKCRVWVVRVFIEINGTSSTGSQGTLHFQLDSLDLLQGKQR